ncbi:hypothetical protein OKW21_006055 [Catalinimonas alkaloidigena]|nr:hypothetical protein [Catalinimonas alkaloidigena]
MEQLTNEDLQLLIDVAALIVSIITLYRDNDD